MRQLWHPICWPLHPVRCPCIFCTLYNNHPSADSPKWCTSIEHSTGCQRAICCCSVEGYSHPASTTKSSTIGKSQSSPFKQLDLLVSTAPAKSSCSSLAGIPACNGKYQWPTCGQGPFKPWPITTLLSGSPSLPVTPLQSGSRWIVRSNPTAQTIIFDTLSRISIRTQLPLPIYMVPWVHMIHEPTMHFLGSSWCPVPSLKTIPLDDLLTGLSLLITW